MEEARPRGQRRAADDVPSARPDAPAALRERSSSAPTGRGRGCSPTPAQRRNPMTEPTTGDPRRPPDSPSLLDLATRLRADRRRGGRGGERVPAEDYRQKVPALAADREAFLDLVWSEWLLREELGETPTPEEYFRRFPEFEPDLRAQLEL